MEKTLLIKTIIVKGKVTDPGAGVGTNYNSVELQDIIDQRIKNFLSSNEFRLMAQEGKKILIKDFKEVIFNHIKIKSKL